MPYPKSPFPPNFDTSWLFQGSISEVQIAEILQWLCTAPEMSTYRVNTLKTDIDNVQILMKKYLEDLGLEHSIKTMGDEVIILHHNNSQGSSMNMYEKEVMVDGICGAAILRGAHIYAPGVLGMVSGTKNGDIVSVYVDAAKKCKKGLQKIYQEPKIFIGNGRVLMNRHQLFTAGTVSGIAVEMLETLSNCPALDCEPGTLLLQNLPSIITVQVLDPQPGEHILDMCASPGNKTTHIAALMRNCGTLTAIDKTLGKTGKLQQRCGEFGAKVEVLQDDSTKFSKERNFDRILLDAPCSALGKRPQFFNTTSEKVLKSFVPLQKKLFANAVELLKPGGILVYSTCTITVTENEGIVAWALRHFPQIKLVGSPPHLGSRGFSYSGLSAEHLSKVQRFGPNQAVDSVGFFIAKFAKDITIG